MCWTMHVPFDNNPGFNGCSRGPPCPPLSDMKVSEHNNMQLRTTLRTFRFFATVAILGSLALVIAACNDDGDAAGDDDGLTIADVWARPGEPGDNSAAYMQIENNGSDDVVIVDASSDVAEMVEVHESQMEDGMMHMEHMHELAIPAGETVSLEPGGYHVMLMHPEQELAPGDTFSVTLHFDELDDIELEVTVQDQ